MTKPLCVDLFCGLFGWGSAFAAEGWRVVGFDIEDMGKNFGLPRPEGCELVLRDVREIHGSELKDAACIVSSPPCQEFSYMAMPWSRARRIERALRGDGEFPEGYTGSRTVEELCDLFNQCFRIQREAIAAAGRHIPLVVENVRGAQKWAGKAQGQYGSFYLWGDVPALMPSARRLGKTGMKNPHGGSWDRTRPSHTDDHSWDSGQKVPGLRFDTASVEGTKQPGIGGLRDNGKGDAWFQNGAARSGSKSSARKAASAMIAKIPESLARHIARTYKP